MTQIAAIQAAPFDVIRKGIGYKMLVDAGVGECVVKKTLWMSAGLEET